MAGDRGMMQDARRLAIRLAVVHADNAPAATADDDSAQQGPAGETPSAPEVAMISTPISVLAASVIDGVCSLVTKGELPTSPARSLDQLEQIQSLLRPLQQCESTMAAVLLLARAASTRPTAMPPVIVSNVASLLSPAGIVETIVWVSLQQCFYRSWQRWIVAPRLLLPNRISRPRVDRKNGGRHLAEKTEKQEQQQPRFLVQVLQGVGE